MDDPSDSVASRRTVLTFLLVWASLLASSFLRNPVPAINEPHYLAKARHYVDSSWCVGDFFLNSYDVQTAWFLIVGPLCAYSLPLGAVIARVIGYGLLAFGWTRFAGRCCFGRWAPLVAIWGFLSLVAVANFSGEWMVGGIESKVYAYGFLFLSLSLLSTNSEGLNSFRNTMSGLVVSGACAGLCMTMHPVVGGWHLLAIVFSNAARLRPRVIWNFRRSIFMFACPMLLCAVPGLIPAVGVVLDPTADAATRASGNYVQVFGRLKHHLDPFYIHAKSWIVYGLLLCVFLAIRRRDKTLRKHATDTAAGTVDRHAFFQFVCRYLLATLLFAIAGLFVGAGPRPASEMTAWEFRTFLLKFYPFRLFDLMLPVACVVGAIRIIPRRNSETPWKAIALATMVGYSITLVAQFHDRYPDRMNASTRADWQAVCAWIQGNLDHDVVVMTPSRNFGFKWYAHRAEYVSYKDCPQDANGILEWNRRLWFMQNWASSNYSDKVYTREELEELRAEGITHVLAKRLGPMRDIDPIYQNDSFRLYELARSP